MKNLDPGVCKKLKEARRKAGLSQSELAAEIGCKQSALSMFEGGDGTKLNDDAITKFAAKFGIDLEEKAEAAEAVAPPVRLSFEKHTGFCPNPSCPSHRHYEVEGRALLFPNRAEQDPAGGRYCAVCGEVLERKCPNCGSPVHDGAICTWCGQAYVSL